MSSSPSVEDVVEIQELLYHYNRAIDANEFERLADIFTTDGVFDSPVVGAKQGREELIAGFRELKTSPATAKFHHGQHWVTNEIIEGDGTAAMVTANVIFVVSDPLPAVAAMSTHECHVVKDGGRWKFKLRRPSYDGVR